MNKTKKNVSKGNFIAFEGIENLYEAMRSSNEQGGYKYNEEIIKSVKMVLENYPKLEKIHEEGSIHSEEERKY